MCYTPRSRFLKATEHDILERLTEPFVAVGIQERIKSAVKVGQPEGYSIDDLWHKVRVVRTEVKHDMEWKPAGDVREDDVTQGDEYPTLRVVFTSVQALRFTGCLNR